MKDDELKQLFEAIDAPPAESARREALAAAMRSFEDAQADESAARRQGFAAQPRPIPESPTLRRKIMNVFSAESPTQRWAYSGMASAAILVVGVFVTLQLPPSKDLDSREGLPGRHVVQAPVDRSIEVSQPEPAPVQSKTGELDDAVASSAAAGQAQPRHRDLAEESASMAAAPAAKKEFRAAQSMAAKSVGMSARSPAALQAPPVLADTIAPPFYRDDGRDRFETVDASSIKRVGEAPVSTFSIDVDTAAYSFVRRQLNHGVLPQKAAVRVEEMVNYFPYDYPLPESREQPFRTDIAVIDSPWRSGNKLLRLGIQGYELQGEQPRSNLVFLLDVSGSMNSPDKLPLVKQSMGLLLSRLQPSDTVAIAVYAGAAGTVLEPTPVSDKQKILDALGRLQAGGSTAGGAGIELAYQMAEASFVEGGVNRILLATDGDFNVGIQDRAELQGFVERKRDSGIYLSVLGFGQGNYNDALMQALAQNGNGIAAYIDTLGEAQKVLIDEATSSLFPIAQDVKIQVEFNPATVSEYRLLGYETRALAEEDFNNDAVDAGDIGAGHSVTAIYEITPAGSAGGVYSRSRYQQSAPVEDKSAAAEYGFLQVRYKLPGESTSQLISAPIGTAGTTDPIALRETRFAAAVAGFAELLRGGKYTGSWGYADALTLALANRGDDPYGYRNEFAQLVRRAETASAM